MDVLFLVDARQFILYDCLFQSLELFTITTFTEDPLYSHVVRIGYESRQ
jgi:hypothetical protein